MWNSANRSCMWLAPMLLFLVFLQSCSDVKQSQEYQKVAADRDSLFELLERREKEVHTFSQEFDQIERNLGAIDTNKARLISMTYQGKGNQRQRIHTLIADIYIALDQNQTAIRSLEEKVKQEAASVGLRRMVQSLKDLLQRKEAEVNLLKAELSNLQLEVKDLKDAIRFKEQLIAQKDTLLARQNEAIQTQAKLIQEKESELNRVYFIRGTAKELEQSGIVRKEGGLIGLGSVKVLGEKLGGDRVKVLNAQADKMLLIGRYKKKKVISNHPSDSYFFIFRDGQFFLKISFPDKFWSLSKYLVVEVE